jgi:hypothetical protein
MKLKRFCERCDKELDLDYDGIPIPEITLELRNRGDYLPAGYHIEGYLCTDCAYKCRELLNEWLAYGKETEE